MCEHPPAPKTTSISNTFSRIFRVSAHTLCDDVKAPSKTESCNTIPTSVVVRGLGHTTGYNVRACMSLYRDKELGQVKDHKLPPSRSQDGLNWFRFHRLVLGTNGAIASANSDDLLTDVREMI
jgi:hypothetical protein